MAKLVKKPAVISTSGTPVEEVVGRVNTNTTQVSIARMRSHRGWVDAGRATGPPQAPSPEKRCPAPSPVV